MKNVYGFCIFIFGIIASLVAQAQIVALNSDGTIAGNIIHKTNNFAYYSCGGVVNNDLVAAGYTWLTNYSNMLEVAPPQDQNCVVSQGLPGTIFASTISVKYFINEANSLCFYSNHCNDSRAMSLHFKDNKIFLNFMVVNAAKSLTKQMCVGLDGKIVNQTGCRSM